MGLQDPVQDQSSPRPGGLWLLVFNSQAGYLGANQEPREVLQFFLHHILGQWGLATNRCLQRSTCPSFSRSSMESHITKGVVRTLHALPELEPPRDPDGSSYACFFA